MKKNKVLYSLGTIYKIGRLFSTFFLPMSKNVKIKNLKISEEVHTALKVYCDKNGLTMYKFLEKIIMEKCEVKKDIYGDEIT